MSDDDRGMSYRKNDGLPFEMCSNNLKEHPEGKCIVDICISVEPM